MTTYEIFVHSNIKNSFIKSEEKGKRYLNRKIFLFYFIVMVTPWEKVGLHSCFTSGRVGRHGALSRTNDVSGTSFNMAAEASEEMSGNGDREGSSGTFVNLKGFIIYHCAFCGLFKSSVQSFHVKGTNGLFYKNMETLG